jgi:hypothetical protein
MYRPVLRVLPFVLVTGVSVFSVWAIVSRINSASVQNQLKAQQATSPFGGGKLEPVRPPLDADVLVMSERERDGLFGPVKKVIEYSESTSSTNLQWNPKWAKLSGRILNRRTTYDINGNVIARYQMCGTPSLTKYILNSRGREVEEIGYNRDGTIAYRSLSTYDERGWKIESKGFDGNGVLSRITNYKYVVDPHGNWIAKFYICVE